MTTIDDGSRGPDRTLPGILVGSSVCVGLATLSVGGRFLSKYIKKASFAVDDGLIVLALSFTWAIYALFIVCRGYGLGKHREEVEESNVLSILKILYFLQIIYVLTPATIKLSLLLMYRRIFVSSRITRITDIVLGILCVWIIIEVLMAIFNCTPISAFWTGRGKCLNFRDFAIGYAVINIVTDLVVWAMPIPRIWQLHLPRAQKFALILIFTLGLFSCGASLARLLTSVLVLDNWDVTWDFAPSFLWSIAEPSVGIMCTCLPTMRALVNSLFQDAFRGIYTPGYSGTGNHTKSSWHRSGTYNDLDHQISTIRSQGSGATYADSQSHFQPASGGGGDNDPPRAPDKAIRIQQEFTVESASRSPSVELSALNNSNIGTTG